MQNAYAMLIAIAVGLFAPGQSTAGSNWRLQKLDPTSLPVEIVPETRARTAGGLPDGLIATLAGGSDIVAAWYMRPTRRYGHAILGDGIEAGELQAKTSAGQVLSVVLPQSLVFEDRVPRLADLDGDGRVEIITIQSALRAGGSITVYGIIDGVLHRRATTGFIGRANRWLNVAGIADFLGNGAKQIAFVKTPHIGGTLYLYQFAQSRLTRVAEKYGFSNHVIGSREMRLSATADVNGDGKPDLILPSAHRRHLRMVGFQGQKFVDFAAIKLPSRIDKAIGVARKGSSLGFTVGLSNSQVYKVIRP